jgi:hypothetical protein
LRRHLRIDRLRPDREPERLERGRDFAAPDGSQDEKTPGKLNLPGVGFAIGLPLVRRRIHAVHAPALLLFIPASILPNSRV